MVKTVHERDDIIEKVASWYVSEGWRLQGRGEVWMELHREAKPHRGFMRVLAGLFPCLARRDQVLTITVDERGRVRKRVRAV